MKTVELPKTVTIKRSKWLRGTGEGCLLDDKGKMCCLGFLAREAGFSSDEILNKQQPQELSRCILNLSVILSEGMDALIETNICVVLMSNNDDRGIGEAAREEGIKEWGQKIGVDFKFED